jgi:hypothetical protein
VLAAGANLAAGAAKPGQSQRGQTLQFALVG